MAELKARTLGRGKRPRPYAGGGHAAIASTTMVIIALGAKAHLIQNQRMQNERMCMPPDTRRLVRQGLSPTISTHAASRSLTKADTMRSKTSSNNSDRSQVR